MSDEQVVESGQFSQLGQKYQPHEATVGSFEPSQLEQLVTVGRLYVVADGLGGTASGEVAGRYIVRKILHDFYHANEPDLEKRLREVVQQANTAIVEQNRRHPERRPMATTVIAALIHRHKLTVANVGDSRAYVVWDKDIEHLTGENGLLKRGDKPEITPAGSPPPAGTSGKTPPETTRPNAPLALPAGGRDGESSAEAATEAEKSNTSNPAKPEAPGTNLATALSLGSLRQRLPRTLGLDEQVEIDIYSRRLFAGDIVVLVSGGLAGYVTEAEVAQTVTRYSPEQASHRLAELAHERGSRDNISISVTRVLTRPVGQATMVYKPLPLPGPPEWEALTKPPLKSQPTSTQPLKPTTAVKVEPASRSPRRRWPVYAIALLALVLLVLVGFLVGRYLIASEQTPANADVRETEQVILGKDQAEGATPAATRSSNDNAQAQLTGTPRVVESHSPLPTPIIVSTTLATSPTTRAPTGEVMTSTLASQQPIPVPTIALPPGCTNRARFAGDRTVEDGQEFPPGAQFDKVWSLANYGTCPWGGGYTIRFIGGDFLGLAEEEPVVVTVEVGATGPITVPMVAPLESGPYRGTWQMYSPAGESFGPEMYVEINVVPGAPGPVDESTFTTLYNFLENAPQAIWSSDTEPYLVLERAIDRDLVITAPSGIVVRGEAEVRGISESSTEVLLTHPHQELGLIEGVYSVAIPLQPTDALLATLGFPKTAILNDDGVTFEVTFTPTDGQEQLIFSKLVQYRESPVTLRQPLTEIEAGQSGVFTLRVLSGDSLSYDWALWIDLRLIRP